MLIIAEIIFFFIVFVFLLYRATKRSATPLSLPEITLALGVKVLLGCLYGYIFYHYFKGDDTWMFQHQSVDEYQKLVHQPGQFFKDLLPITAIDGSNSFWQAVQFYIMDLEHWLTIKLLAIFNIFSRGNYYVNVVFFNTIVFWGHYWLFSLLVSKFPEKRKWLFLFIFLFPPVVFWLSGIRADGLLLFFLSLLLLACYRWLQYRKKIQLLYIILSVLGLLIFRDALLLVIVPPLIAWFIVVRYQTKPLTTFITVYGISVILFFATTLFSSERNLPAIIVKRQQEYFHLKGNTRFNLDTLQPTVSSFVRILPQSVNNVFLRPYIWEANGILQVITACDLVFFWLLVAGCWFRREKRWLTYLRDPVLLVMLFFSISLYLFIGYTVPYPGAIARYKILGELLLLLLLVLHLRLPGTGRNKQL